MPQIIFKRKLDKTELQPSTKNIQQSNASPEQKQNISQINQQRKQVLSKNGSRSSSANPTALFNNNKQNVNVNVNGNNNNVNRSQSSIGNQQNNVGSSQKNLLLQQSQQKVQNNYVVNQKQRIQDFQLFKENSNKNNNQTNNNNFNQNSNNEANFSQQNSTYIMAVDGQQYLDQYNNNQNTNNQFDSSFDYNGNTFGTNNQQHKQQRQNNFKQSLLLKPNNHVFYDNFSNLQNTQLMSMMPGRSTMVAQNLAVKQRQQQLDKNMDNLVLFDPHRMFRGEQNHRVQEILKSGKTSLTLANMKRNRFNSTSTGVNRSITHNNDTSLLNTRLLEPTTALQLNNSLLLHSSSQTQNHHHYNNKNNSTQNNNFLDITQHLIAFSNSLKPFYKQSKIVPETMLDEKHKNKECYVLQVLPKSQQSQQRRNIRTATTGLSYNSQSQLRNRILSSEAGRFSRAPPNDNTLTKNLYDYDFGTQQQFIPPQQQQQQLIQHLDTTMIDNIGQQNLVTLQRKFEDNEANIIHDLYSKHFQHKQLTQKSPPTNNNNNINQHENQPNADNNDNDNKNKIEQQSATQSRQILENYLTNPNESLTLSDNNNMTTLSARRLLSANNNINNNIHNNIYENTQQLDDNNNYEKVKYVQYIPKNLNESGQESMINQMYLSSPNQIRTLNASMTNKNLNNSMTIGEHRCLTSHQHARQCHKFKDLDVADLQNKAFQQLKVQNQQVFDKKSKDDNRSYKASFFPTSQMPEELIQILKETREFQKTMLINDKLLMSKPEKFNNTQSRFYQQKHSEKNCQSPQFQLHQLQVLDGYLNQNQQLDTNANFNDSQRNALLMLRRSQLAQKTQQQQNNHQQTVSDQKFEETFDSNKVDPQQLNYQEQQLYMDQYQQQDLSQQNLNNMNSDLHHHQSTNNNNNRNFYYPKVSILNNNNFNNNNNNNGMASQDSKLTNQQHQLQNNMNLSSWDFSQTPISQHVLRLNIEKECVKYHKNNINNPNNQQKLQQDSGIMTKKNIILTSKTPSEQDEEGLTVNQFSPQNPHNQLKRLSIGTNNTNDGGQNNLTQQIFRPRNLLSAIGSSQMLSPTADHANTNNNNLDNTADQNLQQYLKNRQQANTRHDHQQQQQQQNDKELNATVNNNNNTTKFFNFNEINKLQQKKWQSPFIHQKNCEMSKKINLKSNELHNFEKSNKVQLAQSLNSQVNTNPYQVWNRNANKSNYQTRKRQSLQSSVICNDQQQCNDYNNNHRQILSNSPNKQTRQFLQQSNSRSKNLNNNSMIDSNSMPNQLMAFKVKKYQRPNTTQFQKKRFDKKRRSAKGIDTLDFNQNQQQQMLPMHLQQQQQQYQSLGGQTNSNYQNNNEVDGGTHSFFIENQNNQMRFETESLSMSSGNNINVTVNQQSSPDLQNKGVIRNDKHNNKIDGNKRLIISKRSGDIYANKKKQQQPSRMMFNDLVSTTNIINQSDNNFILDQ